MKDETIGKIIVIVAFIFSVFWYLDYADNVKRERAKINSKADMADYIRHNAYRRSRGDLENLLECNND